MGLEYKNLFFEGRFFKALNLAIYLKISSSFPNILNFFFYKELLPTLKNLP